MEEREIIALNGTSVIEDDVEKRLKTTGVKGLDFEQAKKLGVFTRISNLLCVVHASIMAAYRVYGGVEVLMEDLHGRKNEIAREMNKFEKDFERFVRFWTGYYAHGTVGREVGEETETLFRHIMEWAQLPYQWNLGDKQRVEDNGTDVAIRLNVGDRQYTFRTTTLKEETLGDGDESWCVSKYDTKEHKQTIVEENMDKASAMMVAKRFSGDDKANIYTACMVHETMERKTVVTPYKAYVANETVGRVTKLFK